MKKSFASINNIFKKVCLSTIIAVMIFSCVFTFFLNPNKTYFNLSSALEGTLSIADNDVDSDVLYPSNHSLLGQASDITADSQHIFVSEPSGIKGFTSAGEFVAHASLQQNTVETQLYQSIMLFDDVLFALKTGPDAVIDMFDINVVIDGEYKYLGSHSMPAGTRAFTITINGGETMLFAARNNPSGGSIISEFNLIISKSNSGTGSEITVSCVEGFTLTTRENNISKMRCVIIGADVILAFLADSRFYGTRTIFDLNIAGVNSMLSDNSLNIDSRLTDILKDDSAAISDFDFSSHGNIIFITDIQIISITRSNKLIGISDYNTSAAISHGKVKNPAAVKAVADILYIADTLSGSGFIQSFNIISATPAVTFKSTVVFSVDTSEGRLSSPRSSAVRGDNLYIADYQNNRVDIINCSNGNIGTFNYPFIRPSIIEIAGNGTIYIVDNGSRLSIFDAGHNLLATVNSLNSIADLSVSGNNTAYIADSDSAKIYYIDSSYEPQEFAGNLNAEKISADIFSDVLYVLCADGNLYALEDTDEGVQSRGLTDTASLPGDIQDFTVDYDKNIFVISSNILYKFVYDKLEKNYISIIKNNIVPENAAKACGRLYSIEINLDGNTIIGYGDILLCDSKAGNIRRISAVAAGVATFDYSGIPHPVDYLNPTGVTSANHIQVRKTKRTAVVFKFPSSHEKIIEIDENYTVLILQYNLSETDYFCMVALELKENITFDSRSTAFICGYMLKDALSDAEKNIAYSFANARVLNSNTSVYKYPTLLSVKLKNGGNELALNKDTDLTILPWAYKYTDRNNYEWVAINYNGIIGFVLAPNLIAQYYQILSSRPRPNATISTDNITGIPVYEKIDDEYVKMGNLTIPKKARISIVGNFDQNSDYTEIIYTDSNGSLQCYVATCYINTDNLSTAQIVAVILLLLLICLAVILYILKRNSQAKLESNDSIYLNG